MAEESKKTLYILTNAGGWADDVEEETEVQESSKTKTWDKIEKPKVVPIGSSDFEIKGTKDQGQQEQEQRRYQNNGQRNNRNQNDQRFRNDNGKPSFFNKDKRGGYRGDRRQNGRSNDEGSRWERKSNNNYKGSEETRTRKPLVLAPRTITQTEEPSITPSEGKESPFGLATPKITGKDHLETTGTSTSTVSEQDKSTTSNEVRERKPRANGSRNFGSSNSSPFGGKRRNNQNKRYNNEKKMTHDGFQIQTRNRRNRSDYNKNRYDNKRNDSERVTEVNKPATIDVNTHNTFSILSED